jgi:cytochrome c biogenesis protein CcmG, thiol:disulfide interchange protein DsbE
MTLTPEKDCAISNVRSVEPSSTTMISKLTPGCDTSDSRHAARLASSLRAGTMTDTPGWLELRSRAGSGVIIRPILYYSFVRRLFLPIGLLTFLLCGCYRGSRPAGIGTSAPDFTVQDADRRVTLSDYRGKVVVLNFWATWCPPCVEETPSLLQMQRNLRNKGVTVLAVSIDDDDSAYHQFLKDYHFDVITVRDASKKSNNLYGTFKFPETYVIDRDGIVRRKFIGAVDWNQPEIVDFLSKL